MSGKTMEISFYPKYMIRHSLDVLLISLLLMAVLLFSFLNVGPSLVNFVGVGFLLLFILEFSRLYIRRIVFTSSYFLVEKYVWPSIKIDYSDVIDMGASKVKTRRGEVSFAAMSNFRELQSLFIELLRQGKIDINQFENKALNEEMALRKSFLPSIIISVVLGGTALLYWYYHHTDLALAGGWLVFALIIFAIVSIIYWIYKGRTKIQ